MSLKSLYRTITQIDPRISIALVLFSYLILGFTVLGFNRSPFQALVTTLSAMLLEFVLTYLFRDKKIQFPLSAMITSFSLSLLLNYSHNYYLLFIPVLFAIGSKYIFTFKGKHIYNPAQFAVSSSLIFVGHLITSAPAYQWNGIASLSIFMAAFGSLVLVPSVKRHYLVFSFLFFFTLQCAFRAWLMQHHLPFETLFLGTLSSPAFLLFTFFMITDPATSPSGKKQQIILGFALALLDLIFHIRQSYYTFFYAGFTIQSSRLLYLHFKEAQNSSLFQYIKQSFIQSGYYKKPVLLGLIACVYALTYTQVISPNLKINNLALNFSMVSPTHSGIDSQLGKVYERVDPRVQHIVKWLMSIGDSVAIGDYNNDGLPDIFLTNLLKKDQYRNALYQNLGNFQFKRIPLPAIKEMTYEIEKYGMAANAYFVDYDNDLDLDLFLSYSFGKSIMLKNTLTETGIAEYIDVSKEIGLTDYTNSLTANFLDVNNDGRLDLMIGNVWPIYLPDYPKENQQRLNLFNLPKAEYAGDERMFNFMHASWHMADNGGTNYLYIQNEKGQFIKQDPKEIGMSEHFWTLAIGTGDFNGDGFTDLYMANDFGPDNMYYNQKGKKFKKIEGKMFGDIGLDTYKGMNASVADVDNNGHLDIYISNVHHEMQAEGSLLWMFSDNQKAKHQPIIKDMATTLGALNENRFGWGASIVDFNNDGFQDIAQANGMVDDTIDKKWDECPDYWYVNEKIARSAPSIHRYINKWGDIRGMCIYGKEKNRLYLNTGNKKANMFVDVADQVGMEAQTNSRGIGAADFNNDGKLDMVVTHMFAPPTIYQNQMTSTHIKRNWIGIDLRSQNKTCNGRGVGSTLKIKNIVINNKQQNLMREVQVATGFEAQNDPRVHFGLGDYTGPVQLEVNWCNQVTKVYQLQANQYHQLVLN